MTSRLDTAYTDTSDWFTLRPEPGNEGGQCGVSYFKRVALFTFLQDTLERAQCAMVEKLQTLEPLRLFR